MDVLRESSHMHVGNINLFICFEILFNFKLNFVFQRKDRNAFPFDYIIFLCVLDPV